MTKLASLTVVSVFSDAVAKLESFDSFAAVLEDLATDFDFVIVANAGSTEMALQLKVLIAAVPDATVVFLADRVHDDLARLVGIEHAVGDYVMFCDLTAHDPAVLPALFGQLRSGYDLVVGDVAGAGPPQRPWAARLLSRVYVRLYAAMTGVVLERRPTGLRVLSRAAALFLSGRSNAELLLRARNLGTGFPATTVSLPPSSVPSSVGVADGHAWYQGLGMLLSVSSVPLRTASIAALIGGILSVVYSLYVFLIYVLKPDVATGWTTLSLQLAGMMFIFSIVLLLISEYILQIHSASPPRSRRYLVLRELRSPWSRRSLRLNIVDAEGRFQVGKPSWLMSPGETRASS